MISTNTKRVAILYYGDREMRLNTTLENRRLPSVFEAFERLGVKAEPVVYHDDFFQEIQQQLSQVDAVLTWVNPIEDGRDRSKLDSLLRQLAGSGIYVSTHPDIILKLGTKEVLVHTKELGWGSDTHFYSSLEEMRHKLPQRLARGEARVIKQYRGQSGEGVWRIEFKANSGIPNNNSLVHARHAKSGCYEEVITLGEFYERCSPYFAALNGQGRMVDQPYQARLLEGMVRCYLVQGRVEGFGRQEIVALHPAPEGGFQKQPLSPQNATITLRQCQSSNGSNI